MYSERTLELWLPLLGPGSLTCELGDLGEMIIVFSSMSLFFILPVKWDEKSQACWYIPPTQEAEAGELVVQG
jgi:hypothetical protein